MAKRRVGVKFHLVDWLFRMGVVGPGSLRDSWNFRYFRVLFAVDARGEYVEGIYRRGRFFVDALEVACQSERCELSLDS